MICRIKFSSCNNGLFIRIMMHNLEMNISHTIKTSMAEAA